MKKYESEESRRLLAKEIAADSIVLLENWDQVLPLACGTKVAIFGHGQIDTQIGGGGSGASSTAHATNILEECKHVGLLVVDEVEQCYREAAAKEAEAAKAKESDFDFSKIGDLVASGLIYELFGRYTAPTEEPLLYAGLAEKAAKEADTAICVISRASGGEECDRRKNRDYYLLESEKQMVDLVCDHFKTVIVVLNLNGVIDTAWMKEKEAIKAVLFMGTPGEQGAVALAEILTGKVNPSGRLSETFALSYEDYPTAKDFSYNKDDPDHILEYRHYGLDAEANGSVGFEKSPVTVYTEGIYLGYRYFDTFEKPVMYPFGYGLSYATFTQDVVGVYREGAYFRVQVKVTNTSAVAGKDVVQVYVSQPEQTLEQPYKKLIGFGKTGLLAAGAEEVVDIRIPLYELASYSEKKVAYILEAGDYVLRAGSCGSMAIRGECDLKESLIVAGKISVTEEIVVVTYANRMPVQECNTGKVTFLSKETIGLNKSKMTQETNATCVFSLGAEDGAGIAEGLGRMMPVVPEKRTTEPSEVKKQTGIWQWEDVKNGLVSLSEFVAQMSVEELAVLANGYGPGLPFSGIGSTAPATIQYEDGTDIAVNTHKTGNNGYVSPALPKYGIPSVFYKDGPAGVRLTAWPTGMVLACSFNPNMAYEFGAAAGSEAESQDVDSWLAPAVNLHRNPLGGRNFEYFSEDPYLSGIMGVMVARGAEENNHVSTCPKHFALNEQETYRRGSAKKRFDAVDSIVSERAARELYLKPFEMIVRGSQVKTMMSSFNKINGVFAGGSKDLCTHILREEWGYEGVVVTDWGDMDIVVDGADAVAAGNDVVMPGGPPVIAQVLKGYEEGRVTLEELRNAAEHLLLFVLKQR